MKDSEIIKAMQCVMGNDVNCSECTYQKVLPFPSCRMMCAKNALDLINRQKAEIERVEKELMKCKLEKELLHQTINQIKSEAIKEFAERLKDSADKTRIRNLGPEKIIFYTDELKLDKLVKEMAEVRK